MLLAETGLPVSRAVVNCESALGAGADGILSINNGGRLTSLRGHYLAGRTPAHFRQSGRRWQAGTSPGISCAAATPRSSGVYNSFALQRSSGWSQSVPRVHNPLSETSLALWHTDSQAVHDLEYRHLSASTWFDRYRNWPSRRTGADWWIPGVARAVAGHRHSAPASPCPQTAKALGPFRTVCGPKTPNRDYSRYVQRGKVGAGLYPAWCSPAFASAPTSATTAEPSCRRGVCEKKTVTPGVNQRTHRA